MSRGKPSSRAFHAAVAAARARGMVVFVRTWPGSPCDFLLVTHQEIIAVCVRRSRRIQADTEELERNFQETLSRIRSADHCAGVACEFWLWSPYGTMRYFRLAGKGLIELDLFGQPLDAGSIKPGGPAAESMPAGPGRVPAPVCIPGNPERTPGGIPGKPDRMPEQPSDGMPDPAGPGGAPGHPVLPEKNPGAGNGPSLPAGPAKPDEPAPIRFLRRRNAGLQRRREEDARKAASPPGPARGAPPGDPPSSDGEIPFREDEVIRG